MLEQTAEDLAEADKQRREDFKTYEMEKEFEKQQKLKELDDEKQKKYLEELEEQKQKHKKHDPVPVTIGSLAWWRPFLCYALLLFYIFLQVGGRLYADILHIISVKISLTSFFTRFELMARLLVNQHYYILILEKTFYTRAIQ